MHKSRYVYRYVPISFVGCTHIYKTGILDGLKEKNVSTMEEINQYYCSDMEFRCATENRGHDQNIMIISS